ncbi:MAG: hypothetical protein R3B35_15270 [Gemmatimonadales bacterium]
MFSTRSVFLAVLVATSGCSQGATLPTAGTTFLLAYAAEPTTSQAEAASALAVGGMIVIRTARTIAVRADVDVDPSTLRALPGVVRAVELGTEANPRVSTVIAFDAPPTADQVRFIEGLGGDAVYPLTDWAMVSAIGVPLSRVIELDRLKGVTSVEIQVPGQGPRVG